MVIVIIKAFKNYPGQINSFYITLFRINYLELKNKLSYKQVKSDSKNVYGLYTQTLGLFNYRV